MRKMYSENQIKDIVNKGIEDGSIHADPSTEVKVSDINSESQTAGKVIVSDGEGGAEWGEVGGGEVLAYEGTILLPEGASFTNWSLHRAIKDGNILWVVLTGIIVLTGTVQVRDFFSVTLPQDISNKIYRADGTTVDQSGAGDILHDVAYVGTAFKYISISSDTPNLIKVRLSATEGLTGNLRVNFRVPIFLDIGTVQQ